MSKPALTFITIDGRIYISVDSLIKVFDARGELEASDHIKEMTHIYQNVKCGVKMPGYKLQDARHNPLDSGR